MSDEPDRSLLGSAMAALWPVLGGNMLPAEMWEEIGEALERVLYGEDTRSDEALLQPMLDKAPARRWNLDDLVRKKRGSSWRGKIVGFYSASLTEEGYAVESLMEPGNVQVYPAAALEDWDGAELAGIDKARVEGREAGIEEAAKTMENLCFFTDVDELIGMTKQQMSVRTCHEGAAAIRDLLYVEIPRIER